MCQPDFHRTWYRSLLAPKGMQSFHPSRLSGCHMAEQEITVTGERFAITGDREIRPICKGLLPQNGRCRVVNCYQCPLLVSGSNEDREITDIQTRITRRFQPEKRRSLQALQLRVICRWSQTNFNTERGKVFFCKRPHHVLAIRWHDQNIARTKYRAKNSRDSSHSRGKEESCSSFQFT